MSDPQDEGIVDAEEHQDIGSSDGPSLVEVSKNSSVISPGGGDAPGSHTCRGCGPSGLQPSTSTSTERHTADGPRDGHKPFGAYLEEDKTRGFLRRMELTHKQWSPLRSDRLVKPSAATIAAPARASPHMHSPTPQPACARGRTVELSR